ncbi:VOC family protein [Arthrobacter sp. UYEF36]|uniref:VOC family protein n=1 Tax=Arthrobacter sp. UYEF36 TaxID=1756366 RepID=UPI0033994E6E
MRKACSKRSRAGWIESQCGWLKDRYGVSWQVVPSVLGELIGGPDPEGSQRAMQAILWYAQA